MEYLPLAQPLTQIFVDLVRNWIWFYTNLVQIEWSRWFCKKTLFEKYISLFKSFKILQIGLGDELGDREKSFTEWAELTFKKAILETGAVSFYEVFLDKSQ